MNFGTPDPSLRGSPQGHCEGFLCSFHFLSHFSLKSLPQSSPAHYVVCVFGPRCSGRGFDPPKVEPAYLLTYLPCLPRRSSARGSQCTTGGASVCTIARAGEWAQWCSHTTQAGVQAKCGFASTMERWSCVGSIHSQLCGLLMTIGDNVGPHDAPPLLQ